MISLLWMVLIGLVIGYIAKWLHPGEDPGGFFATALIGVAGSFIGNFAATMLHMRSGLFMSIAGAILVCFLWKHFLKDNI